jgi:hypothetical protein
LGAAVGVLAAAAVITKGGRFVPLVGGDGTFGSSVVDFIMTGNSFWIGVGIANGEVYIGIVGEVLETTRSVGCGGVARIYPLPIMFPAFDHHPVISVRPTIEIANEGGVLPQDYVGAFPGAEDFGEVVLLFRR